MNNNTQINSDDNHDLWVDEPQNKFQFGWWLAILLGWVVFELTAQPILGAFVTCLKFGQDEVITGFWLLKRDPFAGRGKACFFLYFAYGLWKIALYSLAFLLGGSVLIAILTKAINGQNNPPPNFQAILLGTSLSMMVGFLMAIIFSLIGLVLALKYKVKIWLGVAPTLARKHKYWPPFQGGKNRAPAVLATSFSLLVAFLSVLLGGIFFSQFFDNENARGGVITCLPCFTGVPSFFLIFNLSPRFVATSPLDCWAILPGEEVLEFKN